MTNKLSKISGMVQVFVAIMAVPAGLSMIFTPDGTGIGIPIYVLSGSPFSDFFIPGIFLFLIIGLTNAVGAISSFRISKYAGRFGITLGIVMILWILIQVYFTGFLSFLQPVFFVIGIVQVVLGKKLKLSK